MRLLLLMQSSTGKGNGLKIEVYGSDAALEWAQEEPTHLLIHPRDTPEQVLDVNFPNKAHETKTCSCYLCLLQLYKAGNGYLSQAATIHMHLPPGHPEGYLEAFTNIYLNFANMICATVLKVLLHDLIPVLSNAGQLVAVCH